MSSENENVENNKVERSGKFLRSLQRIAFVFVLLLVIFLTTFVFLWVHQKVGEYRVLQSVIDRLSADSRIAEVLVTQSRYNEATKRIETTIKFLEYDSKGNPLPARHFTFQGNVIQFQALVVRFQDRLVKAGDKLRGKSAYLFLRAFMLDGEHTQVFNITEANEIPRGYKVPGETREFEKKLWEEFWSYALDPKAREHSGIKNAQIEAPGSIFVPGTIYTIHIEHDGGMRIDTKPIPEILRGELNPIEGTALIPSNLGHEQSSEAGENKTAAESKSG